MIETPPTSTETLTYDVHPGVSYVAAMLANMPKKTGKTIDEWVEVVRESGPAADKERHAWLKNVHKLGNTYAGMVVERAANRGWIDSDPAAYLRAAPSYVEGMFAGPKAGLRPIFTELVRLGRELGPDVKVCPCETIVPFYRAHVFAQVKPTTATRIDLGYALKDQPATGRLLSTGGFAKGDRITHRIPITSLAGIDDEVTHWLTVAYKLDGST
jgi:hypothetical protein